MPTAYFIFESNKQISIKCVVWDLYGKSSREFNFVSYLRDTTPCLHEVKIRLCTGLLKNNSQCNKKFYLL